MLEQQSLSGRLFWKAGDLYPFIERINDSGVAIYLSSGWYDLFTQDSFLLFENLTVAKRLTVRPIDHSGADSSGSDYAEPILATFALLPTCYRIREGNKLRLAGPEPGDLGLRIDMTEKGGES